MGQQTKYLLDADSLIRSKRQHYAFDFCPAFWDALLSAYGQNRLGSIAPIRKELLRGNDALADWVKDKVPHAFFGSVDDPQVQIGYKKVSTWVEGHDQYSRAAKQKFFNGADPWLVAVAMANHFVLVTYEVSSSESRALIKLPDVAKHFNVTCIPPYSMLRQLQVVFRLDKRNLT